MGNLFNSINIGLKALQTQKKSLDVTGHNIANANTEGYSRQRVIHTATSPYAKPGFNLPAGAGQMGTGVKIQEIKRMRDQFIDGQIREESQEFGRWSKRYEGLHRIELTFNEPSESSLNFALSQFWQSLQDLSENPSDPAYRSTVRQRAMNLVDTFHTLHDQLRDYQSSLNQDVRATVDKVNTLSRRIADLNKQIISIKASGQKPNDLLDQRDLLFDELNSLVDVQGTVDSRGNLNVSLGGIKIVNGDDIHELGYDIQEDPALKYRDKVIIKRTGEEANITSGELKGILEIRDIELEEYISKLNTLAEEMTNRFNYVHSLGYDLNKDRGGDFFTIDTGPRDAAAAIDITKAIKEDINKIASGNYSDNPAVVEVNNISNLTNYTYEVEVRPHSDPSSGFDYEYVIKEMDGDTEIDSYSGEINAGESVTITSELTGGFEITINDIGDANLVLEGGEASGKNAVALARSLTQDKVIGDASVTEFYESLIATLGVEGQRSKQMQDNQEVLLDQMKNQQAAVSGVSLDEEMANMIQFQQAYNAAAQIITTTNKMLDTLMGILR